MSKKSDKIKSILTTVVTVVAACIIIAAAFFCGYWYRGTKTSTSDWALSIISNYYYKDVDTSNYYSDSLKAFIAEYLDEYSAYYTAEEYAALLASDAGSKSGLGFSYSYYNNGSVSGALLYYIIPNSPFFNEGLRSGDIITSAELDGVQTQFTSSSVISTFLNALDTGEQVTFITSDGREYTTAKADYTASYVWFATNESSWAYVGSSLELTETGTDAMAELPDNCAYICLTQFYGGAASQFGQAIQTINSLGCTDIILDLRSNGGGKVSTMCEIAGYFVSALYTTPQVAIKEIYKDGSVDYDYTTDYNTVYKGNTADYVVSSDANVYVLANGGTASASEALIGVLISYGIIDYNNIYISDYTSEYYSATGYNSTSVKSGRTYGKGIMQGVYVNDYTGEAVKLTIAQTYWPDGTSIHGVGITSSDGANIITAPYMSNGYGDELLSVLSAIFQP